jgi:hypothetical protein
MTPNGTAIVLTIALFALVAGLVVLGVLAFVRHKL